MMPTHPPAVWLGFTGLVVVLLAVDLGVLNRKSHAMSVREATTWSAALVAIALLFGLYLLWFENKQHALEYYAGYLLELSLSVDNLFVFLLILQFFAVPQTNRTRVLKWGIFGAMLLRGIMIGTGALLIRQFGWIVYVFGAILLLTGLRMFKQEAVEIEPERNPLVRLARRLLPFTDSYQDGAFFARKAGRLMATPLFLVVLVVEWSDVVFAIDSIPAIFAVTRDPFIIYSSNIFAILGLRALFFVLAAAMDQFQYLKYGVATILTFIGAKMLLASIVPISIGVSLAVIVGCLAVAVVVSLRHRPTDLS